MQKHTTALVQTDSIDKDL